MAAERRPGPATILLVDHAAALGGAEHSLLALLAAVDRERFRPVLAAMPGPLADAAASLGIEVRPVGLARLKGDRGLRDPRALWRWVRGGWELARLARSEGAAVIHANVLRAAHYAALAARLADRPLVWHQRDILRGGAGRRLLCRQADAVIAISRAAAAGLPCPAKVRVIANPVAIPQAPARSRAQLGLPEGLLVASVGRLRPWKGHHRFVEMAAAVAAPTARFLVIGGRALGEDGLDLAYGESLDRQAAALGLGPRFLRLGERNDLAAIWPHLAVLVHAADDEPFGRVLAEAQAAGVPTVALSGGGVPEVVAHGQTGTLIPPGDIAALAGAVDRLLADGALRSEMGREGRRLADRFSPERHARSVEAVWDEVARR